MKWDIANSLFPLAERCLAARPEIAALATETAQCCNKNCSSGWRRISETRSRFRRDNYFFRFVLPVAELTGWPSKPPRDLALHLAGQLFWCFAWRSLDDVLDSSKPSPQDFRQSLITFSDALGITLQGTGTRPASFIRRVTEMHANSCNIFIKERGEGVRISDAWQRCSQFFIIPKLVLRLNKLRMEQYRQYVVTAALTHDIHDLLTDIQAGTNSPPVKWLREIDPNFPFRPQLIRAWFARAAKELEKQLARSRKQVDPECVILNTMIEEAEEILNELRDRV